MRIIQGGRARRFFGIAVAASTLASVMGMAPAAHAANPVITVGCGATRVTDLWTAVNTANNEISNPGADEIDLGPCTYSFGDGDVQDPGEHTALPEILTEMTIKGASNHKSVIERAKSATTSFRLIEVDTGTVPGNPGPTVGLLTLTDLALQGGKLDFLNTTTNDNSGGAVVVNRGASLAGNKLTVRNNSVRMTNTVFTGPVALAGGIGVDFASTLTLTDSTVQNNSVTAIGRPDCCPGIPMSAGGGIGNAGKATLTNTKVADNRANGYGNFCLTTAGGGIASGGQDVLAVDGSKILHNTSSGFGALGCGASLGTDVAVGGGLATSAQLGFGGPAATNITGTTVSGNTARMTGGEVAGGGGIFNNSTFLADGSAAFKMADSDVKGNQAFCHDTGGCSAIGGGYNQFAFGGAGFDPSNSLADIKDSDFTKNNSSSNEGPAAGGGIGVFSGTLDLHGGNVKYNSAKGGPGASAGGGIFVNDPFGAVVLDAGDITHVSKNKPDQCYPATVITCVA